MRPMDREELLSHLFVLAIGAFMIVAPIFWVQPATAEYIVIVVGALFVLVDLVAIAALRRPRD
jgi:membrane protein CcdC involved in cytochrome C biogenesis